MDSNHDSSANTATATKSTLPLPRRRFINALGALGGGLWGIGRALPARARVKSGDQSHLLDSRIAGSRYYDCEAVFPGLRIGDPLVLRRQPDNPYDERAIEVFWRNHKLGYIPRLDNAATASLLDRCHASHAEIIGIDDPNENWEPLSLRVWIDLF